MWLLVSLCHNSLQYFPLPSIMRLSGRLQTHSNDTLSKGPIRASLKLSPNSPAAQSDSWGEQWPNHELSHALRGGDWQRRPDVCYSMSIIRLLFRCIDWHLVGLDRITIIDLFVYLFIFALARKHTTWVFNHACYSCKDKYINSLHISRVSPHPFVTLGRLSQG